MFPPHFAYDSIAALTKPGGLVLDPLCGRGNGPYTAVVTGRRAFAIDINPLAWLYTAVKLDPQRDGNRILARLDAIRDAVRPLDRRSRSRFETLAWAPDVRGLLRAARRELDWRNSRTDRTLAAFITLHMQDKRGYGLSNQLPNVIACAPAYALRWWNRHGFARAPDVDPVALLRKKIERRYRCGVPRLAPSTAVLGDARKVLAKARPMKADLLLTSPPYFRVANYWNDHWIRLWMLGHPLAPNYRKRGKIENASAYARLLTDIFVQSRRHLKRSAAILVRCDRRQKTADMCAEALRTVWPDRPVYMRESNASHTGVSLQHGKGGSRAREIDFLLLPSASEVPLPGFALCDARNLHAA